MSEELRVTPVSEWKKAEQAGELVQLPSGAVARLRSKFNAYGLMRTGLMNAKMFASFSQMQSEGIEDPQEAVELMDFIACTMFLEPKVVPAGKKPPKGALSVEDLEGEDMDLVLARALGLSPNPEDDAAFRGESAGSGDSEDGKVLEEVS